MFVFEDDAFGAEADAGVGGDPGEGDEASDGDEESVGVFVVLHGDAEGHGDK